MANTYVETSAGTRIDTGRTNTNESMRALLSNFSSPGAPNRTNFEEEGNNFNPPKGMLYYDESVGAMLLYDPDRKKDSPRGTNFTRAGLGIRVENGIAALAHNIADYEIGELVCTVSADSALAGNAAVYLITGNTNAMTSVIDIAERDLSDGDVTEGILADSAVVTAKIQDDAVTNAKIADDAVDTPQIADDAVENAQIADDAVDTPQIADDAVENAQIANDAVDTPQIADDAVENAQIADDAVDTPQIADDAVEGDQIAGNVVNTDHINISGAGSVGQIIGSDGDKSMSWVNRVERGTLRSLNGQSSVEWTSIPSWVKRIEISMFKVPNSGRDVGLVIGDSGGYEETSYEGIVRVGNQSTYWTPTDQFPITTNQSGSYSGNILLLNTGGNMWTMSVSLWYSSTTYGAGVKELSSTLDRLKLQIASGNFSGGQANILYS